MVILAHPTGNENVRQAAQALAEAGLLAELCTSVYWRPECWSSHVLPGSVTRLLDRRAFPHVPANVVRCHPWPEVGRLLANQMGFSRLVQHETGLLSVDAVYRNLDRCVARRLLRKRDVVAVHAYEDGALESFRAARRLHVRSIYELPIGYWKCYRDLMVEEAELQPAWADTLSGNADSKAKRDRKDEELALADVILVPSQFVRRTLLKAEKVSAPVKVVPYGAPAKPSRVSRSARSESEKLRVIFVGSLGQRKGLSYLLEAIEMLGSSVDLTLIGKRVGVCRTRDAACRKYRWLPSLPHHEVLGEIQQHDVMVFPSLFEGFGLVLLEAMACGIPVIATPNGAAPDFLSDGEDGFLVPIRDAEAIAAKLYTLSCDRDRLAAMKLAARRKAALRSWESYRAHLVGVMQQALASHNPSFDAASSLVEFSQT